MSLVESNRFRKGYKIKTSIHTKIIIHDIVDFVGSNEAPLNDRQMIFDIAIDFVWWQVDVEDKRTFGCLMVHHNQVVKNVDRKSSRKVCQQHIVLLRSFVSSVRTKKTRTLVGIVINKLKVLLVESVDQDVCARLILQHRLMAKNQKTRFAVPIKPNE